MDLLWTHFKIKSGKEKVDLNQTVLKTGPGGYFIQWFISLLSKFWKKKKILIESGHNFAHVTTAHLSQHVQNCELIGSLELELQPK